MTESAAPAASGTDTNRLELTGQVMELEVLRHTPAGLPVLNFTLEHRSRQDEAGLSRDVELEIAAKALGDQARLLAGTKLGGRIRVAGFMAAKSARNRQPVLHVTAIEFLEGN